MRTIGRNNGQAYVRFATFEKENYLKEMGVRLTPILGWAERGGASLLVMATLYHVSILLGVQVQD